MTFTAALVAALATTASADSLPKDADIPVVEVRASRWPDAWGPSPLAEDRIGRSLLDDRPGGRLPDVMSQIGGLRLTSSGDPTADVRLSLRGSTPEQVVILVDGRRRNLAQGGGANLANVPLESVEEVVVFRGGASALFGSNALGGAVDIRTRWARRTHARLRVGAGSFGGRSATGTLEWIPSHWRVRASSQAEVSGGDFSFEDDQRGAKRRVANGDFERWGGEVRAERDAFGGDLRVDFEARGLERGVPGSEEFPTPSARLHDDFVSAGLNWREHPGESSWQRSLDVSAWRLKRRYAEPKSVFGAIDERHENDRLAARLDVQHVRTRRSEFLSLGISGDRLQSTTDGERSRESIDAALRVTQEIWRDEVLRVRLIGALRTDVVADFKPQWSPRVGTAAEVGSALEFRASAGRSHRLPSFDDLFWPTRASAAGNPNLRPERGVDVDAGVVYHQKQTWKVGIDVFHRKLTDLIQWMPGAGGIWRPHNVPGARLRGLEASAGLRSRLWGSIGWTLDGSASWLETRDESGEPNVDGNRLLYRPTRTASLRSTWELRDGFELETSWRHVSNVYVTRANTKTLPAYSMGDVRARVRVQSGVWLDVAVTNVTDETVRDFRDFPQPPRAFALGLSWGMKP